MAEGQVKQVLEEELTCSLCLDLFKEPKKLPCDHIYCRDCLRGLAQRSQNATISCPECQTLTQIPGGNDVNNFPTAFRVNQLIEAFQQVQIRGEENRSPDITESCHIHSNQQLAIYCGTCKKQLCRDCVLVTQEHANHEYGFFTEMATKYREKFASEMSQIKAQESSISTALQGIASEEKDLGTSNRAQQCQDDVEQVFEKLISVLQACKQALKDEATAYYSSFTGDFDQQKERLKTIQSEIKSIVASVDAASDGNDPSFLTRMESTFDRIGSLRKEFQAVSLTVPKPWQITLKSVDTDTLRQYVMANCYFRKPADAKMCTIAFTNPKLYVGEQTLTLTLCDSRGNPSAGENDIEVYLLPPQGNTIVGVIPVQPLSQGFVKVSLTPLVRGPHHLHVKVNGAHIRYSPFNVTVYMPPNLLSQPVATIVEFARPVSLTYSQAEDKILATVTREGTIVKVDSQFRLEVIRFPQINEITHGADMNIFYVTTTDNRLHKILNDGRILKTVGRLGKWNGEFNFPNGLRVNKRCELHVCDSRNHRVQVFDLDLNFMRSFGRKGGGQGEFNSPADVDFDSAGNIYITELDNNRIQVFTPAQCHIRVIIPGNQTVGINAFRPVSLFVHDENIYVTDANNHKVWVVNTSGQVVATFGGGFLRRPEGITIDRAGFVYVTSDHSKIIKF